MENKQISKTLKFLAQLMELHDENPFKVRSIANASFRVNQLPYKLSALTLEKLEEINGIGKSTAARIWELLQTGKMQDIDDLLAQTPAGVAEMLQIKGAGPKKIRVIWRDLGIETLGELYYACNENRLIEAKGFGLKTQEEIKKAIEFRLASSGKFLYAQAEETAENALKIFKKLIQTELISFTGAYRRRCEIIESIDLLVGSEMQAEQLDKIEGFNAESMQDSYCEIKMPSGVKINVRFCSPDDFACQLALQTGSEGHTNELKRRLNGAFSKVNSEIEVYAAAGLPYIEPELREGLQEFEWAEKEQLPELVEWKDLKGTLHNHSTWSDGVNTIEEMAVFCRDELKLKYLGISDHSKSAVYAKGLNEERVLAQQEEIDGLNQKLEGAFKIFKGIESDILSDGSLDYPPEILSTFDFVVASVHSNLKMNEEKATSRLIKAIENPYTTMLGHPTGRMLLTRSGYQPDFKKIIDACAANGVVIEINANPLRLDLDWRWHQYALEKGVMLSINPDAHRNLGFYDMRYGIFAARKGGVSAENCLNCMNADQVEQYFKTKSSKNS